MKDIDSFIEGLMPLNLDEQGNLKGGFVSLDLNDKTQSAEDTNYFQCSCNNYQCNCTLPPIKN